jgi:hypothetical protein
MPEISPWAAAKTPRLRCQRRHRRAGGHAERAVETRRARPGGRGASARLQCPCEADLGGAARGLPPPALASQRTVPPGTTFSDGSSAI